jgi:hypothetical protein
MSIREQLDKYSKLTIPIASVALLVLIGVMLMEISPARGKAPGVSAKAYYTTEDQLTGQPALDALFVDDVNRVPPFDHNGKPAYLAIVYQCNGGSVKWVNTLKRYKASVKPQVEALAAAAIAKGQTLKVDTSGVDGSGLEVKSPGPGPWINPKDPAVAQALACKLPAGASSDDLTFCVP